MGSTRFFALLSVACGLVWFFGSMLWIYLGSRPLRHGFEIAGPLSASVRLRDVVAFEAVVASESDPERLPQLPPGLAMGFEEQYVGGGKGAHWEVTTACRSRFPVRTPLGTAVIEWTSRDRLPFEDFAGNTRVQVVHGRREPTRAVGLAAGDRIACVARVIATSPLVLSASEWGCFAGELAAFYRYPVALADNALEVSAITFATLLAFTALIGLIEWLWPSLIQRLMER